MEHPEGNKAEIIPFPLLSAYSSPDSGEHWGDSSHLLACTSGPTDFHDIMSFDFTVDLMSFLYRYLCLSAFRVQHPLIADPRKALAPQQLVLSSLWSSERVQHAGVHPWSWTGEGL